MTLIKTSLFLTVLWAVPQYSFSGSCNHSDQLNSAGKRCAGRVASARSGARLDDNGKYKDSQKKNQVYGMNKDSYYKQAYNQPIYDWSTY